MNVTTEPDRPAAAGAGTALALLLAINLFNYIDRQVLSAALPTMRLDAELFDPEDENLNLKLGALATGFMVSYMLLSPVFGYFGDKRSRWAIVGLAVILWSLASGGTGLALGFWALLLARCLVGVGEAAYGPVAPAMISDLYPVSRRGRMIAVFYIAIPVGSALGFVVGGQVTEQFGWRWAFLATALPGVLLGLLCFAMPEPPRAESFKKSVPPSEYPRLLWRLLHIPSFRYTTLGMTCSTFVLGGVGVWMPTYIFEREARFVIDDRTAGRVRDIKAVDGEPYLPARVTGAIEKAKSPNEVLTTAEVKARLREAVGADDYRRYSVLLIKELATEDSPTAGRVSFIFGALMVVGGLTATVFGGWLGDRLRGRLPGSYFLVSGVGMMIGLPFFIGMLYAPFPLAWVFIFVAIFCLFANTGPMNTVLANVTHSNVRASAFALNILIIHMFGDAISPVIIGGVADAIDLRTGFLIVSGMIAASGVLWCLGAPHLAEDTANADKFTGADRLADNPQSI